MPGLGERVRLKSANKILLLLAMFLFALIVSSGQIRLKWLLIIAAYYAWAVVEGIGLFFVYLASRIWRVFFPVETL